MSVKVQERQVGNVTILEIEGSITRTEGSSVLREAVCNKVFACATGKQIKMLIDLGGVDRIDSGGIGALAIAFSTIANRGGQLKLLNVSKVKMAHNQKMSMAAVLQQIGFSTIVETYDNEAAAVASFDPPGSHMAVPRYSPDGRLKDPC